MRRNFFHRGILSFIKYHHPTKFEVSDSFILEKPSFKFSVPLNDTCAFSITNILFSKENGCLMLLSGQLSHVPFHHVLQPTRHPPVNLLL